MRRKVLFFVLLFFSIISFFAKPDGEYSTYEQILYKCCLLSFFLPLTVASALWCKSHKPAKKLWSIAIITALTASFVIFLVLPKGIQEGGMVITEKKDGYNEFETSKKTDISESNHEIIVETTSTKNVKETMEEMESEIKSEIGDEPISYLFDDEYNVGNFIVHINEIQIRQNVFKAGNHTLELRIFCELTNTSPTEQFFTATKTGNVVGVFYGKEETQISGMDNLLWDKEDYNIGTGITVSANKTKELVVQAGTVITDTITYEDEIKFDIYFRNNDEMLTVAFNCQP